ncbi:hypothetical protein DEU56DRAFT_757596 [Suillus clintonianus]|uniref:uncharacterized protein n=1 Tax=Suillus clintonianus TaxID=1904413 RepID=UPI001B867583|nr:uncharacterized protein DEU56DRAFT_757596 [Suillus clintonianus]KAG2131344.1 hypothetical protein DEU56DRAFT_757596 [Suillus clintonianus]
MDRIDNGWMDLMKADESAGKRTLSASAGVSAWSAQSAGESRLPVDRDEVDVEIRGYKPVEISLSTPISRRPERGGTKKTGLEVGTPGSGQYIDLTGALHVTRLEEPVIPFNLEVSSYKIFVIPLSTQICCSCIMPPRAVVSPKKKQAKRKGLEVSQPQPKKPRAAEPVKASSTPLVSLCLDAASTDKPGRSSSCANAGMGGRNSQLEKIGALLEAPTQAAPPPYSSSATTSVPDTSHVDISPVEPLQPIDLLFRQTGGRFGFAATHAPTVPPDPDLSSYTSGGRKVAGKQAHNTVTGPYLAHSVAPPTGFLDQNLDPALCDVNGVEPRSSEGNISIDDNGKDSNNNNNNNNNEEEQEQEQEDQEEDQEEMSCQQFGWGEVGGRRTEHPVIRFPGEEDPLQPQVTHPITPEFEFQYSHDKDDAVTQTSVSRTASLSMPSIQRSNNSQLPFKIPLDTLPMQPQPQDTQPTQLAWYGPRWKCFLEDAEGECCVQRAVENPFPALVKDLPSPVCEILVSVLVVWDQDEKQFEAGIWPQQKSNMARLVEWVEHAAAALAKGPQFLHFGLDEFYNCVLDGLSKNGNGKYYPKFTVKEYSSIYFKMVTMLHILRDPYHGPKLLVRLQEWAEAGWAASLGVDGAAEARHDHLQILSNGVSRLSFVHKAATGSVFTGSVTQTGWSVNEEIPSAISAFEDVEEDLPLLENQQDLPYREESNGTYYMGGRKHKQWFCQDSAHHGLLRSSWRCPPRVRIKNVRNTSVLCPLYALKKGGAWVAMAYTHEPWHEATGWHWRTLKYKYFLEACYSNN